MNEQRIYICFSLYFSAIVLLPISARSGGLSISVVDDNKHGVSSEIYSEGGAVEIVIGRTNDDGALVVPSYKCNYDKPLLAKPLNASYFNSNQQPCKTPLRFLVHSRITPNGTIAFNQVSKNIQLADGSDGQIDYKIAITGAHKFSPQALEFAATCTLFYDLDAYGSLFKLDTAGWTKINQSREPAAKIFNFDKHALLQLFGHDAIDVGQSDNGISVRVPGSCEYITPTSTDKFARIIEETIGQRVQAGEYKDLKDLTEQHLK